MSSNIPLESYTDFSDSIDMNNCEPLFRHLCDHKELLECSHIGVTTYIKYRIEIKKMFGPKGSFTPDFYALLSIGLAGATIYTRSTMESFISFRVSEDNGYVATLPLKSLEELQNENDATLFFRKYLRKKKLKGKFYLEALFVDAAKIGDLELCDKYVANLNSRLENSSDVNSLKDKVKKAEKWLKLARQKKVNGTTNTQSSTLASPPVLEQSTAVANRTDFFPMLGEKCNHMFLQRYQVSFPVNENILIEERPQIYSSSAIQLFKKCCLQYVVHNTHTHTMFEFQTNDGHIIMSKLRPYKLNNEDMISNDIREKDLTCESFVGLYTLTIYCIDIPAFATAEKAPSLLKFVRKSFEKVHLLSDVKGLYELVPEKHSEYKNMRSPPPIELDECAEPLEKNCKCEKLHMHDYCTIKLLMDTTASQGGILTRKWSISPSDFALKLFEEQFYCVLYSIIANGICKNGISKEELKVCTNILLEMTIDGELYTSSLTHHADISQKRIRSDLFKGKTPNIAIDANKKAIVTVYMVDFLAFGSNKEARECLNNCRMGKSETKISNGTVPAIAHFSLNNSYFLIKYHIETKADFASLVESYKILSTKTILNTSKSTIILFLVQLDPQFSSKGNTVLLLAKISLHILKTNKVDDKKKITVKFHLGNNVVQVLMNETNSRNAHVLMSDVCTESIGPVEVANEFYLEIHYRLARNTNIF